MLKVIQENKAKAAAAVSKNAPSSQTLLTPQVTLCASLKKLGSSVEIRGKDYKEIAKALELRDYATVVKIMSGGREKSYDNSTIKKYMESLEIKPFLLFVKTTFMREDDKRLYCIHLNKYNRYREINWFIVI